MRRDPTSQPALPSRSRANTADKHSASPPWLRLVAFLPIKVIWKQTSAQLLQVSYGVAAGFQLRLLPPPCSAAPCAARGRPPRPAAVAPPLGAAPRGQTRPPAPPRHSEQWGNWSTGPCRRLSGHWDFLKNPDYSRQKAGAGRECVLSRTHTPALRAHWVLTTTCAGHC